MHFEKKYQETVNQIIKAKRKKKEQARQRDVSTGCNLSMSQDMVTNAGAILPPRVIKYPLCLLMYRKY